MKVIHGLLEYLLLILVQLVLRCLVLTRGLVGVLPVFAASFQRLSVEFTIGA